MTDPDLSISPAVDPDAPLPGALAAVLPLSDLVTLARRALLNAAVDAARASRRELAGGNLMEACELLNAAAAAVDAAIGPTDPPERE